MSHRRTHRALLDERGMALPLAMIVLVALTVMVLTFLGLSSVEPQISQSLADTARARYLAESGVEWAFKRVASSAVGKDGNFDSSLLAGLDGRENTADDQQPTDVTGQNTAAALTTLGSPSPLPTRTAGEGTYAVTVRNDNLPDDDTFTGVPMDPGNKFTDTNGIVIVTSTGTYRGATRTIQVAIKRLGLPPFPGAVNVPGLHADTFLGGNVNAENASRYDIDGRDYDRSGVATSNKTKLGLQVQPGIQADLGITYEERVEQAFNTSGSRLGIVKGRNQADSSDASFVTGTGAIGSDAALSAATMSDFLSRIASNPAAQLLESSAACPMVMAGGSRPTSTPSLTNGCGLNQTVSLGTVSAPRIVYVRGDPNAGSRFPALTVSQTIEGAGILIVENGDLQQQGTLRWDGLVLVAGPSVSAAFRSGSMTTIYGALAGLASRPDQPDGLFALFMDDGLDFRVRSSKQNVDMVQRMLALHTILSWRESQR
jgi:hypothetical protein